MTTRINYTKLAAEHYNKLFALDRSVAESGLDKKILNLVKIRASQLNGCLFCLDMHVKEARLNGERELRILHLNRWPESKLFTEKEKTALAWAEQLTLLSEDDGMGEGLELAKEHFSDKEICDLTFAIGVINMWNRLGVAFKPEPGSLDKSLGLQKAGLI